MDSSEPTYVAVNVFENKAKYDPSNKADVTGEFGYVKAPETVCYEGTLMLVSPE